MITEAVDSGTVQAALELAGRAPSVHNTQPWRWELGDSAIHLRADTGRWLPATDPDARDLLMSCGAWLHHLRMALAASDIGVTVDRFPDPDELDLLAVVALRPGADGDDRAFASEQVAAIGSRHSDRRRFGEWPVPAAFLAQLVDCAADQGAVLRVVTEPVDLQTLSVAIRTAEVEHADTFGYAAELRTWTGLAEGTGPDRAGVPAATIPAPGSRAGSPMRRFAGGDLADSADPVDVAPGPADAATVLILGTSSDDRLSHLRAGEAVSAVLLRATTLGLGSSVLSEPLEVAGTRELVRDEVLGGTLSPQLVLRVGWPPATGPVPPRTARLSSVDEVEDRP
jgi:Nitroreductase family